MRSWILLLALFLVTATAASVSAQDALRSEYIAGDLPLDPMSKIWEKASPLTLSLSGQPIALPTEQAPSVKEITVKSINNGREIAFLLEWKDPTYDSFYIIDKFSDSVAVQVPYKPSAEVPVFMGAQGQRVLILQWALYRQENIEKEYADIPVIYPYYYYGWYPFVRVPYLYPQQWNNEYALRYIGGGEVYRKNTLPTPVRELVAEGYGTTALNNVQKATGKGIHKGGTWYVVMKRSFKEEGTENPEWGPGKKTFVAFAVWDGEHKERGSRKAVNLQWTELRINAK